MPGGHYITTTGIVQDAVVSSSSNKLWFDTLDEEIYKGRTGGAAQTLLRLDTFETVALASDVLTPTKSTCIVAAQSGTADDLKTINMPADLEFVILKADAGDTITIKHNFASGNIRMGNAVDVVMSGDKHVIMFRDGSLAVDFVASAAAPTPPSLQYQDTPILSSLTFNFKNVQVVNNGGIADLYSDQRYLCQGRLSPVNNIQFAASGGLHYMPYLGKLISLRDSSGIWKTVAIGDSGHALTTWTQTSGNGIESGNADIDPFNGAVFVGQMVSGTGIQSNSKIIAVNGTVATMDKTATQTNANATLTYSLNVKVYDVFAYLNASDALAFEFVEWTNSTTRATTVTKTDGIYVKNGDATRRYLGTINYGVTGNGSTVVQSGYIHIWNYYNRLPYLIQAINTVDTWNHTSASWRSTNNATTPGVNQLSVVIGMQEDTYEIVHRGLGSTSSAPGGIGIGVDSVTVNSAQIMNSHFDTTTIKGGSAEWMGSVAPGLHVFSALEYGGTGVSFYGDNGKVFASAGLSMLFPC